MENNNSDDKKNSFNLNEIIAVFNDLTPKIITAVKHNAIEPGRGIGYWHMAKAFVNYGSLTDKAAHSGAYLEIRALEAAQKRDFTCLKELCTFPKKFLSIGYDAEKNELQFKESLIRTHEIAANCHIEEGHYKIADEYLQTALTLLTTLQKANPTYGGYLLEASITTKIHQIEKHF
ncbi:hypothetical protein QQ054_04285 [Oscillatoria amoena NRMC-F 0135]|nr:hypothetical protein [Oscillatoria amoena NRMC-F 0135]